MLELIILHTTMVAHRSIAQFLLKNFTVEATWKRPMETGGMASSLYYQVPLVDFFIGWKLEVGTGENLKQFYPRSIPFAGNTVEWSFFSFLPNR